MKSAVISVESGNGPAELFFCELCVKYRYVRTGNKNAEPIMASCEVLESPEAILRMLLYK
jgi:hypothetical protein